MVAALTESGVAEHGKAKMRATQHLPLGASLRRSPISPQMSDVAKETRARLADSFTIARPEVGRAPGQQGRHAQVADPHGPGHRGRDRLHPGRSGEAARCACRARSAAR